MLLVKGRLLLSKKILDLEFLRGEGYKANLRRELYGKERIPEIDQYYQARELLSPKR